MKGPQAAMLMWVANLAVLAGGGALGFYVFTNSNAELDDTFAIPKVKEKIAAEDWLKENARRDEASLNGLSTSHLSPVKRPVKPVEPPVKPPDPPAPKEPTDDELKAELATWVNSKFKLIRTVYTPGAQENCAAFIQVTELGNNAPLVYLPTYYDPEPIKGVRNENLPYGPTYFPTYFDSFSDSKMKQLAQYKIKVVRIESDFVLFNMPSIKREKKFFDVKLTFGNDLISKLEIPDLSAKSTRTPTTSETGKLPVPPVDPTKPKVEGPVKPIFDPEDPVDGKSNYDAKTDTWKIGYEDFRALSGDEFTKYAKVVVDNDGQPMGIQITEDVPDDHVVVKRGGQKGDIIKSVNGKAVKSMADVRKIVKTDYDAGVTTFEVVYERNGVPGRKTFKAPKKK